MSLRLERRLLRKAAVPYCGTRPFHSFNSQFSTYIPASAPVDTVPSLPFENKLLTPPLLEKTPPPITEVGRVPKAEGRTAELAIDDDDDGDDSEGRAAEVELEDPAEAKRGSFSGRGSAWQAAVAEDADLSTEEETLFLPLALDFRACENCSMVMMDC